MLKFLTTISATCRCRTSRWNGGIKTAFAFLCCLNPVSRPPDCAPDLPSRITAGARFGRSDTGPEIDAAGQDQGSIRATVWHSIRLNAETCLAFIWRRALPSSGDGRGFIWRRARIHRQRIRARPHRRGPSGGQDRDRIRRPKARPPTPGLKRRRGPGRGAGTCQSRGSAHEPIRNAVGGSDGDRQEDRGRYG